MSARESNGSNRPTFQASELERHRAVLLAREEDPGLHFRLDSIHDDVADLRSDFRRMLERELVRATIQTRIHKTMMFSTLLLLVTMLIVLLTAALR